MVTNHSQVSLAAFFSFSRLFNPSILSGLFSSGGVSVFLRDPVDQGEALWSPTSLASSFQQRSVCQLLFLDLSQGTVCRKIGLVGLQLPPLPFSKEVAPFSTATITTDFTASFQKYYTLCCSERAPLLPFSKALFSGPCIWTARSPLL